MGEAAILEQIVADSSLTFTDKALRVFRYQAEKVPVFREWITARGCNPQTVQHIEDIPFLPISFFRTHAIHPRGMEPTDYFQSSGTTGADQSRHWVCKPEWYVNCLTDAFTEAYGTPGQYHIAALLPSYLEQSHSSLVFMMHELMKQSASAEPLFFSADFSSLSQLLNRWQDEKRIILLVGVTYALLDFSEQYRFQEASRVMIMETGGMKGRRKEMIRAEVHRLLSQRFGLESVHSEYGMTEMMSQAYAKEGGIYCPSSRMLVGSGDPLMPGVFTFSPSTGQLYVVDLANLYSCSFIQTDDFGKVYQGGQFEVMGRLQGSIMRGCNLLADTPLQ